MKYYKNLIAKKKFEIFFLQLFLVLLGLFVCYIGLESYINNNIASSDISVITTINTGIVGIISQTNIGIFIIGLLLLYYSIIVIPISAPEAQSPEEYEIKSLGENIYIKFREYEFIIKKGKFDSSSLMFKDKNGKFVSPVRAWQISNYVEFYYRNELKVSKPIENEATLGKKTSKFSGMRLATKDEINRLIKSEQLKSSKMYFKLFSLFFWCIGFLSFISIFNDEQSLLLRLLMILIGLAFCYIGKIMWKMGIKDKTLLNKIIKGEVYVAKCYSFDKRIHNIDNTPDSTRTYFEIKVHDKDGHYINEWFRIDGKTYRAFEEVEANLFIIEYSNNTILKAKTNYQLYKHF